MKKQQNPSYLWICDKCLHEDGCEFEILTIGCILPHYGCEWCGQPCDAKHAVSFGTLTKYKGEWPQDGQNVYYKRYDSQKPLEDYNNLHMKPVILKQDYGDIFKKDMCGLCTASIEITKNDFSVAIMFHKNTGFQPPWTTFHFTTAEDYKTFCTDTVGLLSENHVLFAEIAKEASVLKGVLKESMQNIQEKNNESGFSSVYVHCSGDYRHHLWPEVAGDFP